MIQVAKIIGTDLATTGLIGAGVGIGVVFGALILGVARNPSVRGQLFNYAILGFAFSEAIGLFALMIVLLWFRVKSKLNRNSYITEWFFRSPPKPHAFVSIPLHSGMPYHLGEDINHQSPILIEGKGNYLYSKDGRKVFDASGGAAVSCLGHGNSRIAKQIYKVIKRGLPYGSSTFWSSEITEDLSRYLIKSTNSIMSKVYLTGSGSEATEAALKLARLYFYYLGNKNTSRVHFIFRDRSYHGNLLGGLSVSGFSYRKDPYYPLLMPHVHQISSCYAYRQKIEGESNSDFVARKAAEFESKILELGPETIIGFIAEPVVGAALGCVPAVPGYFKAMKDICDKYGILFIVDEVMCGMGRTGSLHAWQLEEGFTPDIQTIGKGLGGGYQPIAAVLISPRIVEVLKDSGPFVHGQTYEGMPVQATAALEVLNIIKERNLVSNVNKKGLYLHKRLNSVIGNHPNVGDIRGRGLFWGIELVKDKETKTPFDPCCKIAPMIQKLAFSDPYNMTIYQATGTVDGVYGDHIMISPSFLVTYKDIDHIVDVLSIVIRKTFENINLK